MMKIVMGLFFISSSDETTDIREFLLWLEKIFLLSFKNYWLRKCIKKYND